MVKEASEQRGLLRTLASCMGTEADRRNQILVAGGIILWALASTISNEMMQRGASVWLVLIPAVVAIGVVLAYARFLRETDEYVRLLQYQGLALAFGLSIFIVSLLESLQKAGHPYDFANESATVMLLSWAAAQFFVAWRHR